MTERTKVLLWQWGRFGAGPRLAALLADGFRALPDADVALSMSAQAEILTGDAPPLCDLPIDTYDSTAGFVRRVLATPWGVADLRRRLHAQTPDVAVCVMPAMLDFWMTKALRGSRTKIVTIVHDADIHPGDGIPLQMWLQRRLCKASDRLVCLSGHVGDRLVQQGLTSDPIRLTHPPMPFGVAPPEPHDGPIRLLHFGRLLPYKGLDLLADALQRLGPRSDFEVRVVGEGPDSQELRRLSAHASVENRWVPETEVGALLTWADALLLPYREASQSGVAAAALAAGRGAIGTRVGGLAEQLSAAPRAILCEPTPESLAEAITRYIAAPPPPVPPVDPVAAWRDMARDLLAATITAR